MKGSRKVISGLNEVLFHELVSINQTFLHARMLDNWGLKELGEREYKKSIKDMKQADRLIARIFFLEGLPNLQDLGKLRIGEDVQDILGCELHLMDEALQTLRKVIALCEEEDDFVSRDLLEGIIEDEEEFLDWLETQQSLIGDMGLQNYMQSQV